MTSRREFLAGSIASTLLAGLGCTPASRAATTRTPLYKAVYDERYAEALQFASEISALGVATVAMRGDITDLWFNDLDRHWRKEPAAVAGLTTESALFCLERLAWDHRLRVVFRADHAVQPDCIEHTVSCASGTLDQLRDLEKINTGWWAPEVAHVVAGTPANALPDALRTVRTPASPTASAFLVSWVIAPVKTQIAGVRA